jgi:hypothetical protein
MSQSSQADIDLAPIALFVYNRPDHTRLTVEALLENELSAQSDLFIYSDAARKPEDAQAVLNVRSYLTKIKGFKTVTIIERPVNFGLAKSIIDGVTSICERNGKVIVLEDDLITSRYFLGYMNNALVKYAAEEKIISVHGYCYPVTHPLPEVFFLRGADCWGWATWKRGWDLFEHDANKLYSRLQASGEQREFDFDGQYPYTEMLKQQIEGRVNSWAIRWYASAFLANRLTLYPGVSLVQNIGNDNSGTHKGNTDLFKGKIALRPVVLEDMAIVASDEGYKAFREYFYTLRPTLIQRLKIKAKKILNKWQAN